jgi:hypothetical protein
MDVTAPLSKGARDGAAIAQQMNKILRDEIASGALANIASAARVWSAHRRDHMVPELARRLAADVSDLLSPVLDLIAPLEQPAAHSRLPPTEPIEPPPEEKRLIESVPVLRARRPGAPGDTVEIRTALRNDGPTPVDVGFLWSDLVADPGGHIRASCLRALPGRLNVLPSAAAELVIDLRVPNDARPGLYHTLLETTDRGRSCALLIFCVESQEQVKARSPRDVVWGRE